MVVVLTFWASIIINDQGTMQWNDTCYCQCFCFIQKWHVLGFRQDKSLIYIFSILFSMFLLCLHLILVPFCYFFFFFYGIFFIIMGMFRFATWVILLFISSWTCIRSELLEGDGKQYGRDRYCWLLGV